MRHLSFRMTILPLVLLLMWLYFGVRGKPSAALLPRHVVVIVGSLVVIGVEVYLLRHRGRVGFEYELIALSTVMIALSVFRILGARREPQRD